MLSESIVLFLNSRILSFISMCHLSVAALLCFVHCRLTACIMKDILVPFFDKSFGCLLC